MTSRISNTTRSFYREPFWLITAAFVLLKFSLHLFTFNNYELHRDEMLYFNQGEYLSLGNATVPPLISWIAYLIKYTFGYSIFGIRLTPMLMGSISAVFIALVVKQFKGGNLALILACSAFVLSPGYLLIDSLFTVNAFDAFFWLVIAWLFSRMILTNNPKLWVWIGIVSGLAFLNKYLVVYLLAGFVLTLLLTSHRKLLFNKFFIFGSLIGLIVISPNIYWQYSHGWPVLFHFKEIARTQMVNMTAYSFLVDLFDLNYVSTFFWIAGLAVVFLKKSERKYRFIGFVALFIMISFVLSRGKAYYALGIFPMLFALSGYIFEKYFNGKLKAINFVALGIIILFSSLSAPFSLQWLSFDKLRKYSQKTAGFVSYPFSRWEDGEVHNISQVFSDMTGWEELVALVNKAYLRVPENERSNTTIYAQRNYGYAGAVHFYGKQYNLPDAITFLESYVLWAPDTIPAGPMIYIHYELAGLDNLFEKCSEVGIVRNDFFREKGVKVFLCEQPLSHLQEEYAQLAREEKKIYSR